LTSNGDPPRLGTNLLELVEAYFGVKPGAAAVHLLEAMTAITLLPQ
jgi:hypothetical protein